MTTYSTLMGTGSYLPDKVLHNRDLEKMVDTSDEWIVERTGISERRIVDGETLTEMAALASCKALDAAGVGPNAIDLIVFATSTPERAFPSSACLLQDALGIKHCIAFDISAACSGFIYALQLADLYIKSGLVHRALVVGAEVMSKLVDWQDRNTCVLFGDGAGAVVLGASSQPGILSTQLHAESEYKDLLYVGGEGESPYIHMQGNKVFKLAIQKLSEVVTEVLAHHSISPNEIDWIVPHQANIRIIKMIAEKLSVSMDKIILTLDRHGNTSAASIPLALDDGILAGKIRRGQTLLLEAFGGGFTWGSALIRY